MLQTPRPAGPCRFRCVGAGPNITSNISVSNLMPRCERILKQAREAPGEVVCGRSGSRQKGLNKHAARQICQQLEARYGGRCWCCVRAVLLQRGGERGGYRRSRWFLPLKKMMIYFFFLQRNNSIFKCCCDKTLRFMYDHAALQATMRSCMRPCRQTAGELASQVSISTHKLHAMVKDSPYRQPLNIARVF